VSLIEPFGGSLVDLLAGREEAAELKPRLSTLPSIVVSERVACDLEVLAVGGFSPLDRFMGRASYERVLGELRLESGAVFPIPVTLPVDPVPGLALDQDVVLTDARNDPLAIVHVTEIYEWDREAFARQALGSVDEVHPLVRELRRWGRVNISGPMRVLRLPAHTDFASLRMTPRQTRVRLEGAGHGNVVAFQTRNPLHRVHEELTQRAIREVDGTLLLHPVVGMTKPGDTDYITRVRAIRALADHYYEPGRVVLALLPLAMRLAGPREALWHAIIRRNYGANHFIVGRDHAGPGNDSTGKPFYGPYDAQELVAAHAAEIGVKMVPFKELVYLPDEDRYEEVDRVPSGVRTASISGTQVREEYLKPGKSLPGWFTRPEVADVLADTYQPLHRQGVCVWFTGLSGSGKSTTAEALTAMLAEYGRRVTVLDGDVVRQHLSKGLGFSRADRDTNIRRIGYVAAEIVRHGGTAVCAAVSPYAATRDEVRAMVGAAQFVEVFVNTPIEECERRDTKGMYARARRGEIKEFTGIDDPYEAPPKAEIELDTVAVSALDNAARIIEYLRGRGFLKSDGAR
jgi:sulfate adenylyltransferase